MTAKTITNCEKIKNFNSKPLKLKQKYTFKEKDTKRILYNILLIINVTS
jgi:hypothetical protein